MTTITFSWQSFLVLVGLSVGLSPAIAAIPQPLEHEVSSQLMANFSLPDTDRGQPDASTGGGRRDVGTCLNDQAHNKTLFRPILPVTAEGTVNVQTAKGDTTFWWYIPENNAFSAEFSVFTEGEDATRVHYQVIEDIREVEGLISVTLPADTLQVGETYEWDMTLVCGQRDRSGDLYFFGQITRADVTALQLSQEPAAVDALVRVLRGQDSYLSLDPTEAQSLADDLASGADEATVQLVSGRLLWHFKSVADGYAMNSASMSDEERRAAKLELAQLSAFFGLWSDTVNLVASERQAALDAVNLGASEQQQEIERQVMLDEWKSLLEVLFPADNPSTAQKEDEIIDVLLDLEKKVEEPVVF